MNSFLPLLAAGIGLGIICGLAVIALRDIRRYRDGFREGRAGDKPSSDDDAHLAGHWTGQRERRREQDR